MKLRNKKTGEIKEAVDVIVENMNKNGSTLAAVSIDEIKEEWEDYEELKGYWYYDTTLNGVDKITHLADKEKDLEIGNYFETKEEAEKAVEKLKAWKRLKDKGIEFYGWRKNHTGTYDFLARWQDVPPKMHDIINDLDLLFGGEE